MCLLINVYSDEHQSTLKYLKDTEVNILVMTGDFDIRDNNQNSAFLHYSTYMDTLREIANSFDLELSMPINQVLI